MRATNFAGRAIGIERAALTLPPGERAVLWRRIDKKNRRYPVHLITVPETEWPEKPEGVTPPKAVLRSREFLVLVYQEGAGVVRLSIKRTNFDPGTGVWEDDISWDDLQLLKHEAGFGNVPAVEVFPPNRDVVNVASMRHLWLLPEAPSFMWKAEGGEAEHV